MIIEAEYDIIVVGGGTAGVIAALQAARGGMKTLLIEKTEMLGGTITNARVIAPGLFHAWKKQIIKGIGQGIRWNDLLRCSHLLIYAVLMALIWKKLIWKQ